MNTEIARKKCEYVEELIGTIEGFDEYIKDFTLNNACEVKFSFPDGSSIFFEDYNGTRSPNYPLIAADVLIPFFLKRKRLNTKRVLKRH